MTNKLKEQMEKFEETGCRNAREKPVVEGNRQGQQRVLRPILAFSVRLPIRKSDCMIFFTALLYTPVSLPSLSSIYNSNVKSVAFYALP